MEPPPPTTVSKCTTEAATGKHVFKIAGYHLHKGLGVGHYIRSATFAVGGYDWCVRYYPDGDKPKQCRGYVSVYLELLTRKAEVRANYKFRLIGSGSTEPSSPFIRQLANNFSSVYQSDDPAIFGAPSFMKWSELESSPYLRLRDDLLVIECEVHVITLPQLQEETNFGFNPSIKAA